MKTRAVQREGASSLWASRCFSPALAFAVPALLAVAGLHCMSDFIAKPRQPPNAARRAQVLVTPGGVALTASGATAALRSAVTDEQGIVVLGRAVAWHSLNPSVATVDSARGTVTAIASGQAIVSATVPTTDTAHALVGYAVVTVAAPSQTPVGGMKLRPTPTDQQINAMWGASATEIYAVGSTGTILRHDGTSWTAISSGTVSSLRGVWGVGPGRGLIAVGQRGVIVHLDGTTTKVEAPTTVTLAGAWGSSPRSIYAVGEAGTILHYADTAWHSDSAVTTENLRAIWGSSASDIYAVGDGGTIVHYDGSAWSGQASGTRAILTGVWGTGPGQVYVSASDGSVLRRADGTWTVVVSDSSTSLTTVWGLSAQEVYAAGSGGTVLHFDGRTWSRVPGISPATIRALWGAGGGDLHAAGDGGVMYAGTRGGAVRLAVTAMPMQDYFWVEEQFGLEVRVLDATAATDTTATDSIALALVTNPAGATLAGTTGARAARGVATFQDLRVTGAGSGLTIVATAEGLGAGRSPAFSAVEAKPRRLSFRTSPVAATAGVPIAPAIVVGALDSVGRLVPLKAGTQVRMSLPGRPLLGDTVVAASAGVATFGNLRATVAGSVALRATAPGLDSATSATFTTLPGPMDRIRVEVSSRNLTAVGQTATTISLALDAFGNAVAPQPGFQDNTFTGWVLGFHQPGNYFAALGSGQAQVFVRIGNPDNVSLGLSGTVGFAVLNVAIPGAPPVTTWTAVPSGVNEDLWGVWAGGAGTLLTLPSAWRVDVVGTHRTLLTSKAGGTFTRRSELDPLLGTTALVGAVRGSGDDNGESVMAVEEEPLGGGISRYQLRLAVNIGGLRQLPPHVLELGSKDSASGLVFRPRVWLASELWGVATTWNGLQTCHAAPDVTAYPSDWPCEEAVPALRFPRDAWGASINDLHVVGERGLLWLHGAVSDLDRSVAGMTESFLAVWGSLESDVYAVGTGGTIYHFDGQAWSPMTSGTTQTLWDVWGTSSTDLYAVGNGGTILRYDGVQWTSINSGTTADLHAVYGAPTVTGAPGDVYVVGSGGTILRGARF